MDGCERFCIEAGAALGTGTFQPVLHVATRLFFVHGADMAGGSDTLAKLLHVGVLQYLPKLRLTHKECLQQCLLSKLEIRQHAQFFHCTRREVLRFVNNQQAALALAGLCDQKSLQGHQQISF